MQALFSFGKYLFVGECRNSFDDVQKRKFFFMVRKTKPAVTVKVLKIYVKIQSEDFTQSIFFSLIINKKREKDFEEKLFSLNFLWLQAKLIQLPKCTHDEATL